MRLQGKQSQWALLVSSKVWRRRQRLAALISLGGYYASRDLVGSHIVLP